MRNLFLFIKPDYITEVCLSDTTSSVLSFEKGDFVFFVKSDKDVVFVIDFDVIDTSSCKYF